MFNYGFELIMNISVTTALGIMARYILATLYFILILIGLWVLWHILRWMLECVLAFLIVFFGTIALIKLFKHAAREESQRTKREYIS